ncbi:MAG: GNAT family N-acetyltransferase [Jatrophihabitans sp.]
MSAQSPQLLPRFRLADERDWPLIWPVFQPIVAAGDTFAYDPATSYEQGRGTWLAAAPDQTWLAVVDDAVLGTYKCGPNRLGAGSHVGTASFMVAAAARGHGIGGAMVGHCIQRLSQAGYRGVQFNAVAASNVHAVRLYEQFGFATVGAVPGGFRHPQQGFVDLLIMYRDL